MVQRSTPVSPGVNFFFDAVLFLVAMMRTSLTDLDDYDDLTVVVIDSGRHALRAGAAALVISDIDNPHIFLRTCGGKDDLAQTATGAVTGHHCLYVGLDLVLSKRTSRVVNVSALDAFLKSLYEVDRKRFSP